MGIQPAACFLPCHRRQPDRLVCVATVRGSIDGTAQGDDLGAANGERIVHDFGPLRVALGPTSAMGPGAAYPYIVVLAGYHCGGAHCRVKAAEVILMAIIALSTRPQQECLPLEESY